MIQLARSFKDPSFPAIEFQDTSNTIPQFEHGMCQDIDNFNSHERIYGGVLAKSSQWPWFVKLDIKFMRGRFFRGDTCGATVIASNLILTGTFKERTPR